MFASRVHQPIRCKAIDYAIYKSFLFSSISQLIPYGFCALSKLPEIDNPIMMRRMGNLGIGKMVSLLWFVDFWYFLQLYNINTINEWLCLIIIIIIIDGIF